ncbi:alanine racemase, partial [Vibrio parahaemolyticus EKP-028]
YSA